MCIKSNIAPLKFQATDSKAFLLGFALKNGEQEVNKGNDLEKQKMIFLTAAAWDITECR